MLAPLHIIRINPISRPIILELPPPTPRILMLPMTDVNDPRKCPHALAHIRMRGTHQRRAHIQLIIGSRTTVLGVLKRSRERDARLIDGVVDILNRLRILPIRSWSKIEVVRVIRDILGGTCLVPERGELRLLQPGTAAETVECSRMTGTVVVGAIVGAGLTAWAIIIESGR